MNKLFFLIFIAFCFQILASDNNTTLKKRIELEDEKKADARIEFTAGNLFIAELSGPYLFEGRLDYQKIQPRINYLRSSNEGHLKIDDGRKTGKNDNDINLGFDALDEIEGNDWNLKFTNRIPINFDIEIGAAKADIDFGRIKIDELVFDAGVSDTHIKFSARNKVLMRRMKIDAGVAQFRADNLLNANFEHLIFDGGMGKYELDFGGSLLEPVKVSIDMGVGSLKITIPEHIPFTVICEESFFSSISVQSAYKQDGNWYSDNFNDQKPFIHFDVETGMGSVEFIRESD